MMRSLFLLLLLPVYCFSQSALTAPNAMAPAGAKVPTRGLPRWAGSYEGTLPCADCSGLKTTIVLSSDQTYILRSQYLGKSDSVYEDLGKFKWTKTKGIIKLISKDSSSHLMYYYLGRNILTQRDAQGQKITGAMADKFNLIKEVPSLTEKYWKLVELYGKPVVYDSTAHREAYIVFRVKDKRMTGNGGCNTISGTYELLTGDRIHISKVVSTMMACMGANVEAEFLKVLQMADNYNLSVDKLVLNRARMAPLARFEAVYSR